MTDPYHEIYTGEIFQTSQCIWHENTLMDFFRSNLISLGYQPADSNNKVWRRNNQIVVICLVDDFTTCSENYSLAVPYLFDTSTVVITDNHVNVPTQYRVCQLPPSFYGIYSHTPAVNTWQPDRRFCLAINRMDHKRMLMFLEMRLRNQYDPDIDVMDYVNFNCWSWEGDNTNPVGLRENFDQQFQALGSPYDIVYQEPYQAVRDMMPYRNHELGQAQAHVSAWMNIVMETYSSDTTVALSEKTFRALCLPVPWMLYSGTYTIAYLNSLGFDVMSDIVSHRYDSMIENRTAAYGDKMIDFLFEATDTIERMQADCPRPRAQQAANHNQQLLKQMRQQWPQDFAQWWPTVVELIK